MATQSTSVSIPFSIAHPAEHVRLIELPEDVLYVIAAAGKDGGKECVYNTLGGRLQLKSAPTTSTSGGGSGDPKEGFLHLCTPKSVYSVRQVSSSNSVFVVRPSSASTATAGSEGDDGVDLDTATAVSGLTAFAQPTSTLELLPVRVENGDVEREIRGLLPVVDEKHQVEKSSPFQTGKELIASLPFPLYAILRARRECMVIDAGKYGMCIPDWRLVLRAWKWFMQDTLSRRIDVAGLDMIELGETLSLGVMESGEHEGVLLASVVQAIAMRFTKVEDDDEIERETCSLEGKLKGEETAVFLGEVVLRCAEGREMAVFDLQTEWEELVPDRWRKWCRAENLGGGCTIDGATVTLRTKATGEKTAQQEQPAKSGKRNWHEKFAAQRQRRYRDCQ